MQAKIKISTQTKKSFINPYLHGHFIEFLGTCISDGIWVGEDSAIPNTGGMRKDVIDALKKLAPPVIRWPGGCYADRYHWRDGVGPRAQRPVTYNNNFGTKTVEKNHFGTHEFMQLCKLTNAQPWLNINMMTGSPAEMYEWAEYCNRAEPTALAALRAENGSPASFDVKYWGVGNESWAGGGNYTAQGYVDAYRRYATAFPFQGGPERENSPCLIAVGPDGNKPEERVKWTKDFFAALCQYRMPPLHGYDLHFYNWNIANPEDNVTVFDEDAWYDVISGSRELESVLLEQYDLIQDGMRATPSEPSPFGDFPPPECKLIVGEWGNWHRPQPDAPGALFQQCTMRDAITTALTLDIFHANSDKVYMACVAQSVNVLNSLILTFDDKTVLTPNYHVFEMYQPHRNADALLCETDAPVLKTKATGNVNAVHAFASQKGKEIYVNLINPSIDAECTANIQLDAQAAFSKGVLLGGLDGKAHNTPENPDAVHPVQAPPLIHSGGGWQVTLPKASVSVYHLHMEQ